MNTTVLKLSESDAFLRTVSIRTIKDVRALDVDLLLILTNGDRIVISGGAMQALNAPDMTLQFSDGQLPLARVFQQIDHIDVSPEANLTVTSKEITRYNQNNARVNKSKKEDDEGSRPIVQEAGDKDPAAATTSQGSGGNAYQSSFSPVKAADNKEQLADTEVNSDKEKDKSWGVQWPIATGALALLAAAGGGGGGGGSGGGGSGGGNNGNGGGGSAGTASASGSGAGVGAGTSSVEPPRADITGAAALGPIRNANITAYDQQGNALSATTQVVDGKYALVLNKPFYKGPMLLVIRDNTPDVADNYVDEASLRTLNLGPTPLRALVTASGVNQKINVTAFTELAAIKAGLAAGVTSLAGAPRVTAARIDAANNAVNAFFKIDAIAGDVVPTAIANARGDGVANPAYNAGLSTAAQNYGAALKAVSNLVQFDPTAYSSQALALQKLADALEFVDTAGSALRWATNRNGEAMPASSALQAALFTETLHGIINAPNSSPEDVAGAKTKLDLLQNLPNGSTVTDYLVKNHIAIANPTIVIKQAQVTNPQQWQLAPVLSTLKLDQGDFLEGNLRVDTPPNAKVNVTFVGRDVQGGEIRVKLPESLADANGQAILRADDAGVNELLRFDSTQSVTAQVTVTDGYNSRTNFVLWKNDFDVRVDLNTPASMTRFANDTPMSLAEDTYYSGAGAGIDGDTNTFPSANQGSQDRITKTSNVKVRLNQALRQGERLEFSVANGLDQNGDPIYGPWKEASGLTAPQTVAGSSGVVYTAQGVTEVNGTNWIKARIVQVGSEFIPDIIPVSGNNNGTFTLGGIAALSYSVTSLADPRPAASRKEVVLSKTSGEAITSAEAKTILEALRMKSTSTTTVDRLLKITLTDMAGNDSTQVSSTVRVDTRELPTLSVAKVDAGNQISYGLLTLDKDLGRDSFKRNLTAGEEVNLPLPAGFTPSSFLTALKAISSDWGGRSISGSPDIIEDRYRSYLTFTSPPVSGRRIPVGHQAHKDIKGDQVTFDISGGVLSLANRGGFVTSDTDMYRFTSNPNNGNGGYDMGNIRLLYQTTTTNTNSTPTIAVTFDRGRAAVGDTIGLYEGDKLLVSKTLVSTDIAGTAARITLNLTVTDSLAKGDHAIVAKFTTPAGATAQSAAETFAIGLDTKAPVLSNLTVKASYDPDANAKAVLMGGDRYTSVTDPGLSTGFYDKGLIFSGSVNTPGVTGKQKYLVTLNMGGRMLGFDTFELSTTEDARTSSFTLQAAPNLLAPGLYRDLTVTVTNITEGSIHNGQTSTIKDVSLGWYWAPQYMGNLTGGNGNDGMLLSPPEPLTVPQVTTGAGADTLTVGGFGRSGAKDAAGNWINFSATVTDFQLGLDKVQVWKQNITADNYRSFVSSVGATADGRGTALVVDLDGAGAQRQTYTLTLQNVRYDAANTHTIFGV